MPREREKQRFFEWAYGLFIHFGLYSVYGRGEWILYKERMSPEEYRREALKQFFPPAGTAREWVRFAKECGMKYAVLTTRHHDGFFIGDAVVREYCDACQEFGLGVGLYYSVADWTDPDYYLGTDGKNWWKFVKKTHSQIKELMNNYGRIDYLFYDGTPPPDTWDVCTLHKEIRAMQPGMLICRGRADFDVISREQCSNRADSLWESCYTLNDAWGYNAYDNDWKTPAWVAEKLFGCRHNGGNLLINIGPRADGSIQEDPKRILKEVGAWIEKNREAIYSIVPHPFDYTDQEISTAAGNHAYILLTNEAYGAIRKITGIGNKVNSIRFLDTGDMLPFEQNGEIIQLTGLRPRENPVMPRILKLELDGTPFGIKNHMTPKLAMKFDGDRV